jgi:hypothetical protein
MLYLKSYFNSLYMTRNNFTGCFLLFLLFTSNIQAQTKKFDTTVKMGAQGFRVECSNKSADLNDVSVSAIGFKADGHNPAFKAQGKVIKVMTDDMDDDGSPDLLICIYSGANSEIGTIVCITFNATDKNFAPVYFPDIYFDPKIRDGYKGYDEFSILTGTLLRKFPVYLPNDTPGNPTGGKRTVQYKAMMDNGHLSFKVLRWFDVKS